MFLHKEGPNVIKEIATDSPGLVRYCSGIFFQIMHPRITATTAQEMKAIVGIARAKASFTPAANVIKSELSV